MSLLFVNLNSYLRVADKAIEWECDFRLYKLSLDRGRWSQTFSSGLRQSPELWRILQQNQYTYNLGEGIAVGNLRHSKKKRDTLLQDITGRFFFLFPLGTSPGYWQLGTQLGIELNTYAEISLCSPPTEVSTPRAHTEPSFFCLKENYNFSKGS